MKNKSKIVEGKWILGDLGSTRIKRVASAYFKYCVDRLREIIPLGAAYHPWMAASEFSSNNVSKGLAIGLIQRDGILDLRKEYLKSVDELLNTSNLLKVFDPAQGLDIFKIFTDIGDHKKFIDMFNLAFKMIEVWPNWLKDAFNSAITCILPICPVNDSMRFTNNFSSPFMIGAIFVSVPNNNAYMDLALNISFAHELGHQVLMVYDQSGTIEIDSANLIYSGIRKTLRPAFASLHAAVALAYMILCIRSLLLHETDLKRVGFLENLHVEYVESLKFSIIALEPVQKSDICELIFNDLKTI